VVGQVGQHLGEELQLLTETRAGVLHHAVVSDFLAEELGLHLLLLIEVHEPLDVQFLLVVLALIQLAGGDGTLADHVVDLGLGFGDVLHDLLALDLALDALLVLAPQELPLLGEDLLHAEVVAHQVVDLLCLHHLGLGQALHSAKGLVALIPALLGGFVLVVASSSLCNLCK